MARAAISTADPAAPGASGRVPAVDALRGFALGGILLMNIEFFTRPLQGVALGIDPQWTGIDRLATLAVAALVQGKFWTLFSLLFGMGFAVMHERARAAGAHFDAIYARRLAFLGGLGAAHATFVWAGDILVPYFLGALVLWLLFRVVPAAQLWRVGLAIYLLPLVLMWTSVLTVALLPSATLAGMEAEGQALRAAHDAAARVYAEGSFAEVTRQRLADSLQQYAWLVSILPSIVGVFLMGAWLHHRGVLRDPAAHRDWLAKGLAFCAPAAFVLAITGTRWMADLDVTVLGPRLAMAVTFSSLGNLFLCAVYGSGFLLLATRPDSRLPAWLAPAGCLALSNYLLQSLVFTTLFYGYGFGWWGEVPRAMQLLLAAGFFLLQVLLSRAWLARFDHGPVEWLWRKATYLR